MGLFGLFASIFGVGAVVKDAIDGEIQKENSYQRALKTGREWYSGRGADMYSMKTGKRCHMSFESGHCVLKDLKTGQIIEDLTANDNRKREYEERGNLPKGCVFYRKCIWDRPGWYCNVWVSDKIPGFFHHNRGETEVTEESVFYKGELKCNKGGYGRRASVDFIGSKETYYPDGTLCTGDTECARKNQKFKEDAIAKGNKYYIFTLNDGWNKYGSEYRDVKTDEWIYHNYKDDYYTKGELVTREVRIQPHHAETKTRYYVIEVEGEPRYNLDGSDWIE